MLPPLSAVYHPLNVQPAFVAVGAVAAVEFLIPLYNPVAPLLVYNGLVPDNVPSFVVASNVIVALFILTNASALAALVAVLDVTVPFEAYTRHDQYLSPTYAVSSTEYVAVVLAVVQLPGVPPLLVAYPNE